MDNWILIETLNPNNNTTNKIDVFFISVSLSKKTQQKIYNKKKRK